jgi:hypothetical protein
VGTLLVMATSLAACPAASSVGSGSADTPRTLWLLPSALLTGVLLVWCFLTHGLLATLTLSLTALSIALLGGRGGTAWRLWWAP